MPIDPARPEYIAWPYNRTKIAMGAQREVLERARYIEKRRSETLKTICDPDELGKLCHVMARETTQATLHDMGKPLDAWYSAVIQYVKNYMCNIEYYCPKSDGELWRLMAGQTEE